MVYKGKINEVTKGVALIMDSWIMKLTRRILTGEID